MYENKELMLETWNSSSQPLFPQDNNNLHTSNSLTPMGMWSDMPTVGIPLFVCVSNFAGIFYWQVNQHH